MPPAGLAVALGVTLATATIISSILVSIALTVITTVVGMLLQRKPKKNPLTMDDRTITVRQPLTPRQVIYGAARVGGTVFLIERLTGDDILLGVVWDGHESAGIDSIYADDEQIFINSDGSAFGDRNAQIEVYHHLGSDDQTVDDTFKAAIPKLWTDDHRLRGRTYSAILIINLTTNWDNSIPNFSASTRGKLLYDQRTNTTGYSTNSALAILDFLTDERYGYGKNVKLSDIDIGNFSAEANICEESINLPAWGDSFQLENSSTFTVNTGNDRIVFPGNIGPNTGESIYVFSTVTLPAPLAVSTQYFIRATFTLVGYAHVWVRTLHPTAADAEAGTNTIDITTTGTGTHTAIPSNTRFALTGDTMGFSGNAATDVIVPDEFIWLPQAFSGMKAVIILETTGTFASGVSEGVKYKWDPSNQRIYDYPNGTTAINYAAGSTGTFSMRVVAYGDEIDATLVDTATDIIQMTDAESIGATYTGMPVRVTGVMPTPLVSGEIYYVVTTSQTDEIRLATSRADAVLGRYIDFIDDTGAAFFMESMELMQNEVSGFTTGMACVLSVIGAAVLPSGLVAGTTYYLIRTGHSGFSLATSRANAFAGISIAIVNGGMASDAWIVTLLNELRYAACGLYDTDQDKGDVLRGLLSSCAGKLIPPVGSDKWKLAVGAYRMPMISLDERDATAGISLQARRPRRDAVNTVKGTFAGPVNFDQPASLPVITNSNYLAEDNGEELAVEFNLPFTESKFMGMRLLKIELERRRKQRTLRFPVTLEKLLQMELTDGVDVSWARFGWVNKSFELAEWNFAMQEDEDGGAPIPGGSVELIEMGPDVYS